MLNGKIRINGNTSFWFELLEKGEDNFEDRLDFMYALEERFKEPVCRICGISLDFMYLYIIKELKKAGLLSKRYKTICCCCYAKKQIQTQRTKQNLPKNQQNISKKAKI